MLRSLRIENLVLIRRAELPFAPGLNVITGETGAGKTILAQAIHHATEHRAQIAGALATNGNDAIDLDAFDLWEFAEAEGQPGSHEFRP